jgi:hypothetical protein
MTSSRGRRSAGGVIRSRGDLMRLGVIGLVCVVLAALVAVNVSAHNVVRRTERDWRVASETKDKQKLRRISDRAHEALKQ